MADVYAITFIMIGILLSVPGLLVGLNLLFPGVTERTHIRLAHSPGRSFAVGLPTTAVLILTILITAQAGGPGQIIAFLTALTVMGLGSLGAAGLTRLLAHRLTALSEPRSPFTHLLRGAIVYELACLVPFVGWFLFAPLVGTAVIGAATLSLKRQPKVQVVVVQPVAASNQ